MSESMSARLRRGLEELGLSASERQLEQLELYLSELGNWNRVYGFVKAEGEELVTRHLFDSLSACRIIQAEKQRRRIVDVGSGAGLPGIPLAIFLTDSHFSLLERSSKKTAFLRTVAILAGLGNVSVVESRLQDLVERFDLVVFRAFSPLQRELRQLGGLLYPHGRIMAYKGKRTRILEELEAAGLDPGQVIVQPLQVPFLEGERHLVILPRQVLHPVEDL